MKTYALNKRAKYDYDILEKFEAGLVLQGCEVKSIKTGHISLKGARVIIKDDEADFQSHQLVGFIHLT